MLASAAFFAADSVLLRAPRVSFFASLKFDWQGQLLSMGLSLLLIWTLGLTTDAGLVRPREGSGRDAFLVALVPLALNVWGVIDGARLPRGTETLLFELMLPGLCEELAYRGIHLSLLNRAFPVKGRVLGAQVGFGAVLTSLLFLSIHVVKVTKAGDVHFETEPVALVGIGVTAIVLAYIRERTGSLWPCVATHNATNGVLAVASQFM